MAAREFGRVAGDYTDAVLRCTAALAEDFDGGGSCSAGPDDGVEPGRTFIDVRVSPRGRDGQAGRE